MKVNLIEPLGIDEELIHQYGQKISELGHEFEYYNNKTDSEEEMIARAEDADILMIANNPLPYNVIKSLERLKLINVAFTGIDHVATDIAHEKGIDICNASGYSDISVAELVIGLVIDLYRQIKTGDEVVRTGGIGRAGKEIRGKVVGIIGTGNIGIETAKLFSAFGTEIIGYSKSEKNEFIDAGGRYVTLDELLIKSDIISLHIPSNDETAGFIGESELSKMKKDAILINCARGRVVDNLALANALNNELLAGAGIDVFDMEPPIPPNYPLLSAKNTILTPHIAYLTEEAMLRRAEIAFNNTIFYLNGKPQNIVEL